jgi:hypothetical protein
MARKSYIRLSDALQDRAVQRILAMFGVGPLLALGWLPDLRHHWGLLIPAAVVGACFVCAYLMARHAETEPDDYPDHPLDLDEPEPPQPPA